MQKQIKEVKVLKSGTNRKGAWVMYSVTFTDGSHCSTFDTKLVNMAGQTIDAELEQDGQFTNLKSWSPDQTPPQPTGTPTVASKPQTPIQHQPDPHNRSFALAYAKDYAVALINNSTVVAPEAVIDIAIIFEKYLNG